jgi:CheY-specific phosphatase CheX
MTASDFASLVPECCSEVLDAMYFITVLGTASPETAPETAPETSPETAELPDAEKPLAYSLNFAGDISGRFGLSLEQETAHSLAANFLGEEPENISSTEIDEVAGELTNMFCGSVMSRIEGKNKFVLSHPEAIRSQPYCEAEDVLVSRLDTDGGVITVWVVVEGTSCQ